MPILNLKLKLNDFNKHELLDSEITSYQSGSNTRNPQFLFVNIRVFSLAVSTQTNATIELYQQVVNNHPIFISYIGSTLLRLTRSKYSIFTHLFSEIAICAFLYSPVSEPSNVQENNLVSFNTYHFNR